MPIDFRTFARPFAQPFGQAGPFRGWNPGVPGLPGWAKACLFVPMLPGLVLLALSIVLFIASLATLFVLTAPVYLLIDRVRRGGKSAESVPSPGSKRVDAVVRDA